MDRYFIARQQKSKVKIVIPEPGDIDKYSEQQEQRPEEQAFIGKAALCARIATNQGVKTKNIAEYVKLHKLMERPIEELAMLYPNMWKKSR